jgi:hypothetical protein
MGGFLQVSFRSLGALVCLPLLLFGARGKQQECGKKAGEDGSHVFLCNG